MADETAVERLSLEISSNSGGAAKGVEKLASTLETLKKAVNIDDSAIGSLREISDAVKGLSLLGGIKISPSLPKQITAVGDAVRGLYGIQTSDITEVSVSLGQLGNLGSISLGPIVNQLKKLPDAAEGLKSIDAEDFRERISVIASAVAPLSNLGKNNLTSYITQLGKLPDVVERLDDEKLEQFAEKIKKVTEAVKPLGAEMERVSNGFSAFPARIQRLVSQNERLTASSGHVGRSYTDLHHMVRDAISVLERGGRAVAQLINKENEYIENINLFNASMKEYASEAQNYANTVGEIMGIDPGEWMRNQGVFQTLLTGFGVAGDRAAVMSQQLTQLGYDLSSFYNISFADSMQKLQSGISGELEPLRRLGYDLSQAKLQAIALSLGISENVASMTQAEKAQLRYYAILTQVTTAHGDMARTLNSPANQLRIFNSQVEQASRALGSIFIPALNAILPYGIAAAKVIRIVATEIAALAGFELPEVDYSGITDVTGGIADDMGSATSSAKELKRTLLGIDEINRLADNSDSGAGSAGDSGGLSFELPTYDFLNGAVNSRVNEIVEDMKEWLGITGEIDRDAAGLADRFGTVLSIAGNIHDIFKNLVERIREAWDANGNGIMIMKSASNILGDVLGLFDKITAATAKWAESLDLVPIMTSFAGLMQVLEPLVSLILDGLGWAYENILLPFGKWAVEDALPASIDLVSEAIRGLNAIAEPAIKGLEDVWEKSGKPVFEWLGSTGIEILGDLKSAYSDVADLLEEKAPDIYECISGIGDILGETWGIIEPLLGSIKIGLGKWFDDFVLSFKTTFSLILEKVKTTVDDIKLKIELAKDVFSGITDFLEDVFSGDWGGAWDTVKKTFTSVWDDIKDILRNRVNGMIDIINTLISGAVGGINGLINAINRFHVDVPEWIEDLTGMSSFGFNIPTISAPQIPKLASGGMPEKGEMFIAREQGPELVGRIGGSTAVMNNGQIVQSVASGVRDANAEQNALLREQNSLLRKLLEKEFSATVGVGDIQNAMARNNRRVGKTIVSVG